MVALLKKKKRKEKSILQTARNCRRNKACDFPRHRWESSYGMEQPNSNNKEHGTARAMAVLRHRAPPGKETVGRAQGAPRAP